LAKPKQQPGKKDNSAKLARTASNKARRATAHAKRMAEQQLCPKHGLARALRRWVDRTSKEPAVVLCTHKKLASIHRVAVSERRKKQPLPLAISINGKEMGSLTEAVWTIRNLAELAKQRTAPA
jgi:hypothetical protein